MSDLLSLLDPEKQHRHDVVPRGVDIWREYPGVRLYHADNIDVLRALPANSIDSGVTDPPYGIGFMGREWDTFKVGDIDRRIRLHDRKHTKAPDQAHGRGVTSPSASASMVVGKDYDYSLTGLRGFQVFTEKWARELLRVLKPGAYTVVCGAPRSAHRLFCGLEDAGFWVIDEMAWLFGQGFPKSHNLDGEWDGWGSALKPGHEPIALVQKPFTLTIKENVKRWGVGALNIDGCRIATTGPGDRDPRDCVDDEVGRWPANVAMDEEAAALLDQQSGVRKSGNNPSRRSSSKFRQVFSGWPSGQEDLTPHRRADAGGASRFYFVAKPSRAERDFGCDDLPMRSAGACTDRKDGSLGLTPYAGAGRSGGGRNFHPTVKPVALMRWLIRLVTPPGGVVVDPFLGSGTTGMAAVRENCEFIGIEKEEDYLVLPDARITAVLREVGKL